MRRPHGIQRNLKPCGAESTKTLPPVFGEVHWMDVDAVYPTFRNSELLVEGDE
jgi:hypothetical protein